MDAIHARFSAIDSVSFAPLVLSFGTRTSERRWTLTVQSHPVPMVKRTGDMPTRDEIIECLIPIGAPAWLIPVIEVLAATAMLWVDVGEHTADLFSQGSPR
jgi:hypothetical protein